MVSFFDCLDPGQREELLALGGVRHYPARSILFFEGGDAHDVLVVRDGSLEVAHTIDGREVVLGELAAIDRRPRSATATALTGADLANIPIAAAGHRRPPPQDHRPAHRPMTPALPVGHTHQAARKPPDCFCQRVA